MNTSLSWSRHDAFVLSVVAITFLGSSLHDYGADAFSFAPPSMGSVGRSMVPVLQMSASSSLSHHVNKSNKGAWRNTSPLTRRSPTVSSKAKETTSSSSLDSSLLAFDPAVATASVSATAKLLASIGLGSIAARIPNVLDAGAVSALSRLTYWVFQPAFLLCSVSKTFAGDQALPKSVLLLMPVAGICQCLLGAIVAKIMTSTVFSGLPEEERKAVSVCTIFGNSGPLPLIFADALFGARSPALLGDVTACISFYLLAWSPLFWSFARIVLGTIPKDNTVNKTLGQKCKGYFKTFFSPPVAGSALGVFVGLCPPLRHAFCSPNGLLSPVFGALSTLGSAYLPAAVLVLAGSLAGKKAPTPDGEATTTTTSNNKISPASVAAIMMSRFCLAPILSFGIVKLLDLLKLLPSAAGTGARARAVVMFVLLMEGCMPPAQNTVIILQLDGLKDRAASMAKTLALIYSISVIPVTILLSACLAASKIMTFS
uniref:Uncharacterized protein n=1 Tax=Attheya septentrionalis TaxID=420275 RepID=A0A7S2URC9_9STRA|mmetsp:Transcript_9240/g.16741  ORF Transcript_9240/g.16741 Transcript_9240/m.16741 type:complete len:485 (+) Transcript_9240:110-1564(+)